MQTIIKFLLKSSADPRATSLTLRAGLLTAITFSAGQLATILGIFCQAGFTCYVLEPTLVDQVRYIATQITEGVYYALMTISVGATVYGAARKLYRTIRGENLAIKE